MVEVKQMKCACEKCLCVVSVSAGIKDDTGHLYCSEACAEGHKNTVGCGHLGCECN